MIGASEVFGNTGGVLLGFGGVDFEDTIGVFLLLGDADVATFSNVEPELLDGCFQNGSDRRRGDAVGLEAEAEVCRDGLLDTIELAVPLFGLTFRGVEDFGWLLGFLEDVDGSGSSSSSRQRSMIVLPLTLLSRSGFGCRFVGGGGVESSAKSMTGATGDIVQDFKASKPLKIARAHLPR